MMKLTIDFFFNFAGVPKRDPFVAQAMVSTPLVPKPTIAHDPVSVLSTFRPHNQFP
jgi:hypothetical protein